MQNVLRDVNLLYWDEIKLFLKLIRSDVLVSEKEDVGYLSFI